MFEELPSLPLLHFFRFSDAFKKEKKKQLMDVSDFLDEEKFADISFQWNDKGLDVTIDFDLPFQGAFYPNFKEGEAVELFIDTRDLKTSRFPTKFCHHFLILPKSVNGIQVLELTKFRADDARPLSDCEEIFTETTLGKKRFQIKIGLPQTVLYGFDPKAFDRLGFTYRIHRTGGAMQHFSCSSSVASIEKHPNLWATFNLVR